MGSRAVQVALNGAGSHPRMPRTPAEIAADAERSVARGATSVHLHAYDDDGRETLAEHAVSRTLRAVRERCPGVPLNMTTFADIEPDPRRRHELVTGWTVLPDLVPANQGEDGIDDLVTALAGRGVGIEACLLSVDDARRLVGRGSWSQFERVFLEPTETDVDAAVGTAAAMEQVLADAGCELEQVHHGVGAATWAVVSRAAARGHGVRVGLEDTDVLPDGRPAEDNAALVAAAVELVARVG